MGINLQLFRMINGLAYKNVLLDKFMISLSKFGPIIFMAALALTFIYGTVKKDINFRYAAVDTFFITVLSLGLGFVLGTIYYEPRPFVAHKVNLLFPHSVDASFPSDHATGTMSIAVGINNYSKDIGKLLVILSILVGISRVYVGHHYPFDVLGGFAVAIIVNYAYMHFVRNIIQNLYLKIDTLMMKILFAAK